MKDLQLSHDVANLRQEYRKGELDEASVLPNPIHQFKKWFQEALDSKADEPNAMALGTVKNGQPSVRFVLLKGIEEKGFVFYSNYKSRKGQEMQAEPQAALTFFWVELERQVRIEGRVEKISPEESDAYYNQRGPGSRIGAWASNQSQVIANREELEKNVQHYIDKFGGLENENIPRPDYWGGYRVVPHSIEFWQGRPSRLHDRILYTLQEDGSWKTERLAP